MGYQISPGVLTREFDLTTTVPAVSTTEGAFVGQYKWGPVRERYLTGSENELSSVFWKPDEVNFEDFFTAANFLAYGNTLWNVREVIDTTEANTALQAKNATSANTSGFLVLNESHYRINFEDGSLQNTFGTGGWIAKFPGDLGNSLKVSICTSPAAYQSTLTGTLSVNAASKVVTGANTLFTTQLQVGDHIVINNQENQVVAINNATSLVLRNNQVGGATANTAVRRWEYYIEVDSEPNTSDYVANRGGSGDECHVVIADEDGAWTGQPGTILEVFQKLSMARDAKLDDGTSNYYVNQINDRSKYVWWAGHNANNTNIGSQAQNTTFAGSSLPVTDSLVGGSDGGRIGNDEKIRGYDLFKESEESDISLIIGGNATQTVAVHIINNIAEYRQDCVAVLSPPRVTVVNNVGSEAVDVVNWRNTLPSTSWAILDSGWKYQYDKYNDVYRWVPLSGDIAGLMVQTDVQRDPWWSPAGFNRGNIKNVIRLAYNPGKTDRDYLYKNGVNPCVTFPGDGTVLYGDKTLQAKPSAFDRINVRRLFIVLRKAIGRAAKYSLFELNDAYTRQAFKNMVEPFLRDVKGRRGLTDFKVICDETNNTGEVIDNNRFVGDIYLKPARSINFITLNFIAVRTSVEFSEVVQNFGAS